MSRNLAVYGANGSGKSSFVDAVEYVLSNEHIEHLAHEYSGRKQLLGVRNTHTPEGVPSIIHLRFAGDSTLSAEVSSQGRVEYHESSEGLLAQTREWDLMRTILRQDKVAEFIHRTKGQKYAELLPLLGLEKYETAADNLRKLRVEINDQVKESLVKPTMDKLIEEATVKLGTPDPVEALEVLKAVARRYGIIPVKPHTIDSLVATLEGQQDLKVGALEPAQQRHVLLKQVLDEDFQTMRQRVTESRVNALDALDNRIEVLIRTERIVHDSKTIKEIACPACGRIIQVEELETHVSAELDHLRDLKDARDRARTAMTDYVEGIRRAIHLLRSRKLREWVNDSSQTDVREALTLLDHVGLLDDSKEIPLELTQESELAFQTILHSVRNSVSKTAPQTQQLLEDLAIIEAAKKLKVIRELSMFLSVVDRFNDQLEQGEESVRNYVKAQVTRIFSGCSAEIQSLWALLHPNEPIEDVQLATTEDRAVEIQLKFYGKPQPSPRLTLSEGHRNSLALCIFLAVADLSENRDVPILLDDIVSSLDRDHRGRIVHLLQERLGERQVLLFTHDREWYAELKSRLPSSTWGFCTLRPWDGPTLGIQFSQSKEAFDDARSIVPLRPESAGNTVRSMMDYECAIATESLQITLPYRRGDANDRRTCVEFLDKMCAEGEKRLRRDQDLQCDDIISLWRNANHLLKAWTNRSSHTGTLVVNEANELITVCEMAVKSFRCDRCKEFFWVAEVEGKRLQCKCGGVYWRL